MPNRSLPQLLITGATGNIGQALIAAIREQHRNTLSVIAGVHPPNPHSLVAPLVSKVVDIDYDEPATLIPALEGTDYLFLVPSHSQHRAAQCINLVKMAVGFRVKYIVLVSLLGCESRAGVFCSQFRDIEQSIIDSGIKYTFLQCAPLQQNMLPLQANFKHPIGTIAMPIGMGGYSPIHVKDVASCAAICFAEPKEHYEKVYRLTGPEVLSGVSIAGKASLGLARPVRFVNCSRTEAKDAMLRSDTPTWLINGFMELFELISKGFFATLSPDVASLTYYKGVTVEEFFRENSAYYMGDKESMDLFLPSKL